MFEEVSNHNNEMAVHERAFLQKLSQLPTPIAKKWQYEFEDLIEVTPEFFEKFDNFLEARKHAFDNIVEIESWTSEEIRTEIRAVQEVIRQTFGDPHHFLGNGYTAEVYELPIAPHLCIKYIKDQNAYNENNHIRKEFEFLVQLRSYSVEEVRTPLPYFVRIHPSEGHSYGMERVTGRSLSQIIERPGENQLLIQLLKNMDKKTVEKQLIVYIEGMHKNFNVTHGDLFLRNIMLNDEGKFFVIDFGKASYEEIGQDHEMRRKRDIATITSEIKKFFFEIDKIVIE